MDKSEISPCRRFRIKNTRGFETKRKAIRCSHKETIAAVKREILRTQNYCDAFLDFCLQKAQTIEKNIDPDGLGQGTAIYGCKFCDKIFSKSTALGGHISKVHKEIAKSGEISLNVQNPKESNDILHEHSEKMKEELENMSPNKPKAHIKKLPKTACKEAAFDKKKRISKKFKEPLEDEEYMEE